MWSWFPLVKIRLTNDSLKIGGDQSPPSRYIPAPLKRNVSIVLPSLLQAAAAAAVMRRGPLIFITSWQKGDEEKKVLSSQLHTTSARFQP